MTPSRTGALILPMEHIESPRTIPASELAAGIVAGTILPAAAMGRADAFDALRTGKNGPKPFLGTSTKIDAGGGVGVLTRVLYMVAANASGREACADRSAACTAVCLVEQTGKMSFPQNQAARRWRHACFYADRKRFLASIADELVAHAAHATREGKIPALRMDGTTGLPWENMPFEWNGRKWANIFEAAASLGVRTYDYTKAAYGKRRNAPTHHYTFSLSDHPESDTRAVEWLTHGRNVAVVFDVAKGKLPESYSIAGTEYPVVDGDAHDARFLDPSGVIVGLSAKGRAKGTGTTTGFVRSV